MDYEVTLPETVIFTIARMTLVVLAFAFVIKQIPT